MGALEEKPDEFSENINTLKEIYDNYNKGLSKVNSDIKVDLGNMLEAANEILHNSNKQLSSENVVASSEIDVLRNERQKSFLRFWRVKNQLPFSL